MSDVDDVDSVDLAADILPRSDVIAGATLGDRGGTMVASQR